MNFECKIMKKEEDQRSKTIYNPEWKSKKNNFSNSKSILYHHMRENAKYKKVHCNCTNGCITSKTNILDPVTSPCPCVRNTQECDPDLCGCFCQVNPAIENVGHLVNTCRNSSCWYLAESEAIIKPTSICLGMGLFADKFYAKNSFLGFYGGEYTFTNEETKREVQLKVTDTSYVFTADYKGMQVDALYVGNKTRFMNHMKTEFANVICNIKVSNFRKFIVFYAKKDIEKDEELVFDYGDKYNMDWKSLFDNLVLDFAQKKREQQKAIDKIRLKKKHKVNFVENFFK